MEGVDRARAVEEQARVIRHDSEAAVVYGLEIVVCKHVGAVADWSRFSEIIDHGGYDARCAPDRPLPRPATEVGFAGRRTIAYGSRRARSYEARLGSWR